MEHHDVALIQCKRDGQHPVILLKRNVRPCE